VRAIEAAQCFRVGATPSAKEILARGNDSLHYTHGFGNDVIHWRQQ
jgi:hypothetical protein